MRFRPCIDIHNGKVKQIVGGSLTDISDQASENFVSGQDASFYAAMYARDGLAGGHVIMLNPVSSPYYEETRDQALGALRTAPGFLQVGGGICPENASAFLAAGASHVIVTSYVFRDGKVDMPALKRMTETVGRDRLVLDLSCRRMGEDEDAAYMIVTDRWQRFTDVPVNMETLYQLRDHCSEFLVHGVDVEGKQAGPETGLVRLLGSFAKETATPVTYAGGIAGFEDLELIRLEGQGSLDVTIGSALDLFGGEMPYSVVKELR